MTTISPSINTSFLVPSSETMPLSPPETPATPLPFKTVSDAVPVPKDLDDLVRLLHIELGTSGLACEGVDVERVKTLMANYTSNQHDWEKYALFDKSRYTRNLVDDGNGKFNLMILAWPETTGR